MPRTRPPYAPEFRRQMVELVRAGRTPDELAEEFEPSANAIRNWVQQVNLDAGRRSDGLTSDERQELARLRREIKQLRIEREILAKVTHEPVGSPPRMKTGRGPPFFMGAAAWFARETGSIPSGSSSS